MSYIISQFISLIRLLHSESGHIQVAAGMTIGILMGLSPIISLQGLLICLLLLTLRIQIGAALAVAGLTKFLALFLTPFMADIGEFVLIMPSLGRLFTTLYNMPLVPLTKFNHSVIMGGLVLSLGLAPILFFIFLALVKKYQSIALEKVNNSKLGKAIKASSAYQWYIKYENLTK